MRVMAFTTLGGSLLTRASVTGPLRAVALSILARLPGRPRQRATPQLGVIVGQSKARLSTRATGRLKRSLRRIADFFPQNRFFSVA